MKRRCFALLVLLLASASQAANYRIETVAEGLDHPWSIAFLPDGTQLVTERPGRLRVIDANGLRDAPVAGVPEVFAAGQAGLFDVVADRDFATNRILYLSHAAGTRLKNGLRVRRARFDGSALVATGTIFDTVPGKRGSAHYGGRLAQMADGTLLIGVGDGFIHREDAQRLGNHFGKIVRLTQDGRVPPDNPFVNTPGAFPEIWSYGHRNPQAIVIDAATGSVYAHEHGPRGGDELNRILPGRNYGWPLATHGVDYTFARVSPFTAYPGSEAPMLQWTPSIAPAGMTIYRGALFPAWQGNLFVSALVEKSVRRIVPETGEQEVLFTELGERLRDVREGPDGALWLLTDSDAGRVLRVVPD